MKLYATPNYAGSGAELKVDGSTYTITRQARVALVKKPNGKTVAWVLDHKELFLFTEAGQVGGISDRIRQEVLAKYFAEAGSTS